MQTDPSQPLPPARGWPLWAKAILVVFSLATGLLVFSLSTPRGQPGGTVTGLVGKPTPKIAPQGWFNADPPTAEEARGKVVVLVAWAYWCGPCLEEAPHLVQVAKMFQGRPVQFLGLTSEGRDKLAESREFLKSAGVPWPNGYGAGVTLQLLNVRFIPQVFVIDRTGTIVWDGGDGRRLEQAIQDAINAPIDAAAKS